MASVCAGQRTCHIATSVSHAACDCTHALLSIRLNSHVRGWRDQCQQGTALILPLRSSEGCIGQGVDTAEDVDFTRLATRAAGYSGDDLTNVCRDAALNGMRRKISGLSPDQIRCALCTLQVTLGKRMCPH